MAVRSSALFALLFLGLHAWRMPLQYDETVMLLNLHDRGPLSAFTTYTDGTNNHPLLGFILGLFLQAGIVNTFLLRVPSLFGALAFLLGAQEVARRAGTDRVALFVLPVILAWMPIFHDYLTMARGYALGIAFLTWGLVCVLKAEDRLGGEDYRIWPLLVASAVLYALSVLCVPTFALEVALLCAPYPLAYARHRMAVLLGSATLSAVAYAPIAAAVARAGVSVIGTGDAGLPFPLTLHAIAWAAYAVLAIGGALLWPLRKENSGLALAGGLNLLAALVVGYARGHLMAALLLIVSLLRPLRGKWAVAAILVATPSVFVLPYDRIASEPNTWHVTGMQLARDLSPCLSVQRKGIFAIPGEWEWRVLRKEEPLRTGCEDFLMVRDDRLGIPKRLRRFGDLLDPYGIEMYRYSDLLRFGDELRARQ